jgi:hypothetical protein
MDFHAIVLHVECHIGHVQKIVGKIFLDHEAFVSAADDKIIQSISGIYFHDVPQNRFTANLDHGLWPAVGFFGEPSPHTTRKDNYFHKWATFVSIWAN